MKKKWMWIIGFILVLAAAGVMAFRTLASSQAATADELQTATVEIGSLSATLSSSGNIRSGQSATIKWETSGKVAELTLAPGDRVTEDQVLAQLDSNTLSTEMIQAKQDFIDAQQALDDLLNSQLQQAQALQAVVQAQQTIDGLKQTATENTSQAQLALANAQDAYDDAVRTRNKMNYPHTTDELVIEKAETDYRLAKKAYNQALNDYGKVDQKNLTNPDRVMALNRLVSAKQVMKTKLALWNYYLLGYTDNEIAQADAELAVAQANLEKAQSDYATLKDGTSSAEVMLAEATLADAQREWERVKNGPDASDIAAAQAAVDAAQASLDNAQLLAPFAGTLTQVDVKTGDLVSAGDSAFRIDDLDSVYIDLQISEVDLASLQVGQPVTLEFDAIPDKVYNGEVTEIGMIGSVSSGVVNYPVTVRVTDGDNAIRPGMTAAVSIIIAQADDVLLVPNKAIHTSAGQQTVMVLFEGQQYTVPVTVSLAGDSQSAVTSEQLRAGDAVVTAGSSSTTTSNTSTQNMNQGGIPGDMGGPPPGEMP